MKLIKTSREHASALRRLDELMLAAPAPGTSQAAEELERLAFLIEDYEKRAIKTPVATPAEALRFRMEQAELKQHRTNIHHTLKRKPLRLDELRDFIDCYNPANRHKRRETWHAEKNPDGRWRKFSREEFAARDKTSLDLFWLKDDSLADLDNLPEPADLAEEIIENIEAGLNSFRAAAAALQPATALAR